MKTRQKSREAIKASFFSAPAIKTKDFVIADSRHIKTEREKAKKLKKTLWWKNKLTEGCCYYCRKLFSPSSLTMDHLVPLARNGKTIKKNVVTACAECNFNKKYKSIVDIRLKN